MVKILLLLDRVWKYFLPCHLLSAIVTIVVDVRSQIVGIGWQPVMFHMTQEFQLPLDRQGKEQADVKFVLDVTKCMTR